MQVNYEGNIGGLSANSHVPNAGASNDFDQGQFMQVLEDKMILWVKALSDGKGSLYSNHIKYIDNYGSSSNKDAVWPTSEEELGAEVWTGFGATTWVSSEQQLLLAMMQTAKSSVDFETQSVNSVLKVISG